MCMPEHRDRALVHNKEYTHDPVPNCVGTISLILIQYPLFVYEHINISVQSRSVCIINISVQLIVYNQYNNISNISQPNTPQ